MMMNFEAVLRHFWQKALDMIKDSKGLEKDLADDQKAIAAVTETDTELSTRQNDLRAWFDSYKVFQGLKSEVREQITHAVLCWSDKRDPRRDLTTPKALADAHRELMEVIQKACGKPRDFRSVGGTQRSRHARVAVTVLGRDGEPVRRAVCGTHVRARPGAAVSISVLSLKDCHRGQDEGLPHAGLKALRLKGAHELLAKGTRIPGMAEGLHVEAERVVVPVVLLARRLDRKEEVGRPGQRRGERACVLSLHGQVVIEPAELRSGEGRG